MPMRYFLAAVLAICTLSLAHAHAEPPPAQAEAPAGGVPEPVAATAEPAPELTSAAPPAPAPAPAPASVDSEALRASLAAELKHADAWVAFEANRDGRTRKAEKVTFPLLLGIETALAVAYAATITEASDTSRVLAGATAGLTLAAMLPSVLASSRSSRRAWFTGGAAAFAVGAGATFLTAEGKQDDGADHNLRWVGASVAVQGLLLLPAGFIAGLPEESEYQAYALLPAAERPAAAARLITRVDRFEQRAAAIALFSTLAGAVVLGVGALASNNEDQARSLGGLTLVPVFTSLVAYAPRLFQRTRLDRFNFGEPPRKLPLNGW
jgi:hypothetical protein